MKDAVIGFAMTGSFCTFQPALEEMEKLAREYKFIIPIISEIGAGTDTRFGMAEDHIKRITEICGRRPWTKIKEVEPIGPKGLLDLLIIAPCTGNTLGKMAHGITDSVVSMAAKAHLRNEKPILLAVSTNDGLGASGKNIMELYNRKNVYLVPFGQDDPAEKPASLKADFTKISEAVAGALSGKQLQPVLI